MTAHDLDLTRSESKYSHEALETFAELDRRVDACFERVKSSRPWLLFADPRTPVKQVLSLVREIFRSISWYQPHTTEAGFHMFGRLPKGDVQLIRALCSHKAEEAEHGLWAWEDYKKLGGDPSQPPMSPATFAVAAVWWRMAQVEEPLGYLGAEYLFEQLTALVAPAALEIFSSRGLSGNTGLRFIAEHAVEDHKHATFLKHMILDTVTRYPQSSDAMLRCYDYFEHVYPLPVWEEAYERACSAAGR
jgi:hypothetical protein